MSLTAGTRFGSYEIGAPLGKGGMGEVYRAVDTKLKREVAIKVLPEEFSGDEDRMARFEREARLLAQLNHVNIATLHGFEEQEGLHFLIMELVEGETLADRLAQSPLSVDEAVTLFVQIADGLEAAHEKGIIHRDLKPANIKINPNDEIKILDFGLAKVFFDEEATADSSRSPTRLRQGFGEASPIGGTALGAVLGTASYMSPEQARGKRVDRRTDIWALGVCLFEALSGKKPFDGETVTDVLAAVVKTEPRWESLSSATPPAMRRLLRRCLSKSPRERLHHAADVRIELESVAQEPPESTPRAKSPLHAGAIAVAMIAVAVAIWSFLRAPREISSGIVRSSIAIDEGLRIRSYGFASAVAFSPDGRYAAYVADRPGSLIVATDPATSALYLRAMDSLTSRVIEGSEGAAAPFFSPDSKWLGFASPRGLMKVAVSGGAPVFIAEISGARGASFSPDGMIIYARSLSSGLWRVSAEGGEAEELTVPDRARREKGHRHPEVLPGGKAVLYTVGAGDMTTWDEASIAVLSLETGEQKVLIQGGTFGRYASTGHIVYGRGGNLLAVPFDLDRLEITGSPTPVVEGVSMSAAAGNAEFGITRAGALLYAPKSPNPAASVRRFRRDGTSEVLIGAPRLYTVAQPSPDGRFLAVWIEEANGTIFVHDFELGTSTRLISGFDNHMPVWSPDGRRIAFRSNRDGKFNLYAQAIAANSEAERLTTSEWRQGPTSWSPDGKMLAYQEFHPESGEDIWLLSLDDLGSPAPFLQTKFDEQEAVFSPSGRWLAYQSDESGKNEIYVQPYPPSGRKWRVSVDGGTVPRWNPQGRELFYKNGDRMMVVDIDDDLADEDLTVGTPRLLFEKTPFGEFAVMTDGQSFVAAVYGEASAPDHLILVQNWTEELKRLLVSR